MPGVTGSLPSWPSGMAFWEPSLFILNGSSQPLTSSHLRERDKMLLRAILCGSVWNGFLLGTAKKEDVPCRFFGKRDGDGHLFWECTFHPLLHVRELPEFATLMALDRSDWPRCLKWRGWLPRLSCTGERDPWATSFGDLACCNILSIVWVLILGYFYFLNPSDSWDADDIALEMSDTLNISTDGSRQNFSSIGCQGSRWTS